MYVRMKHGMKPRDARDASCMNLYLSLFGREPASKPRAPVL